MWNIEKNALIKQPANMLTDILPILHIIPIEEHQLQTQVFHLFDFFVLLLLRFLFKSFDLQLSVVKYWSIVIAVQPFLAPKQCVFNDV